MFIFVRKEEIIGAHRVKKSLQALRGDVLNGLAANLSRGREGYLRHVDIMFRAPVFRQDALADSPQRIGITGLADKYHHLAELTVRGTS